MLVNTIMNVYMYKDSGSKTQDIRTHCITVLANISQFFTYLYVIYTGYYTSAHVLLNLLNKLGKRDKMHGFPSILSLFLQRVL